MESQSQQRADTQYLEQNFSWLHIMAGKRMSAIQWRLLQPSEKRAK